MEKNNEEPIVLDGVEVGVSNFGFKKVEDSDEIMFNNQRDGIVSLLNGTILYYDSMINDPRLNDEARKKLEDMKEAKVNIIKNELTSQLMSDFNEIMDVLSNPDTLAEARESALKQINEIISICREDLHDDKLAIDFENRVSTLQDAFVSMAGGVKSEEKGYLVDFESMTNNELSKYLFDLEEKIKEAAKKSNGDIPNDEVRKLLDESVRLQEEIDKRLNGITAKKEDIKSESKKVSSLEDELDDFDKERDKVSKAAHFSKESRDEMLADLYEEREVKKGGRKR